MSGVLPALREELRLLPGAVDSIGSPTWMVFDPVRNAFHQMGERGFRLLSAWKPITPEALQTKNPDFDEADIRDMAQFLYQHKLTVLPPEGDVSKLASEEHRTRPPWWTQMTHKYLFFRIPLVRPEAFLRAIVPSLGFIFTRTFWAFITALGAIGVYFAARQWEQFSATFLHFLTFEGAVLYGLTLIVIKALHELGHAVTAHRFGCRVPVIGLAFLVMFPILYTDTTDAHRLTSRRARVLIDAAGIMTEMVLACISILLWSFLPDGPLRSAAFFVATTSWTLSLLVNLNPMMRFDGYYLLSDAFGVKNLQSTGFAAGRWRMREALFGLRHAAPSARGTRFNWMCVYAYSTWIYRLFLFVGIALLVYHLFPKAVGIVLFTIEILFFIIKPIWRELREWWSLRMSILKSARGRMTLSIILIALVLLFVPWRASVSVPAVLRPAMTAEIYPTQPAHVDVVHVQSGQFVREGQALVTLSSREIHWQSTETQLNLAHTDAQLARRSADRQDRDNSEILLQARAKALSTLQGLAEANENLILRAPFEGYVQDLHPHLHSGRYMGRHVRAMRIVKGNATGIDADILMFARETEAARIRPESKVTFRIDGGISSPIVSHINQISPTALTELNYPILASTEGGPIAVREGESQVLHLTQARIKLVSVPIKLSNLPRTQRGMVRIPARREAPFTALWRSINRVLIREADF